MGISMTLWREFNMKQLSIFTIACFSSFGLLFAQPKIEIVGGDSFNFGELYKGEKVERKVTIKNAGKETLLIERVHASCGCTAALLADKNVAPGKTTALSISFDSKNFSGEQRKNVFVYSNDPSASAKEITFTAKVIQVIEATPPYFYFMPGKVDSTMENSATLKNISDKPVEILSVTSVDPLAKFALRKNKLAPGESTQLSVTFTPSKIGYVSSDVLVKTSHPKQPEFAMKLVCNVRRPK